MVSNETVFEIEVIVDLESTCLWLGGQKVEYPNRAKYSLDIFMV